MTPDARRRWAGAAALTAALVTAANFVFAQVLLTDPAGDATFQRLDLWQGWMHLPSLLFHLVVVAAPTVGGALLLSDRHGRQQAGAAVAGTYGLLTGLLLPSYLVMGIPPVELVWRIHTLITAASLIAAVAAAVLSAMVLAGHQEVGWEDPRTYTTDHLRITVLVALIVAAIVSGASPLSSPDANFGGWFGGMFSVGFAPGAFLRGATSWLLPAAGLVVVGLAIAGARPARLSVVAGITVVAMEFVGVLAEPINAAIWQEVHELPVRLTGWYWVRVVAATVLVLALVSLHRSSTREART